MFMPPVMTRSAQARSASLTSATFLSTSRHVQLVGSRAATVSRPRGIAEWRAPPALQMALLFQNVAVGNRGDTRSTLHGLIEIGLSPRSAASADTIDNVSEANIYYIYYIPAETRGELRNLGHSPTPKR